MCFRERREHAIFQELLKSIPGLEERLVTGSDDEVMIVAELVGVIYHYIFGQQFYSLSLVDPERSIWCSCWRYQKPQGRNPWLDHAKRTSADTVFGSEFQGGSRFSPWANRSAPLPCRFGLVQFWVTSFIFVTRNVGCWRINHSRIKAKLRSGEMAVSGDQWPLFLYAGYTYDPEDPWNGLLRSGLLVSVSDLLAWLLNHI